MIAECFLGIGAKKIKRSMAYKTPIRFVLLAAPVLINQKSELKKQEKHTCRFCSKIPYINRGKKD